ncbi:hypothetical protein BDZ89DRAFT_231051 [Hymenopellis radicata]|nr:hypothetical protein BDZ89DRAFT_231051 [Hymenopellis radicata]
MGVLPDVSLGTCSVVIVYSVFCRGPVLNASLDYPPDSPHSSEHYSRPDPRLY